MFWSSQSIDPLPCLEISIKEVISFERNSNEHEIWSLIENPTECQKLLFYYKIKGF